MSTLPIPPGQIGYIDALAVRPAAACVSRGPHPAVRAHLEIAP